MSETDDDGNDYNSEDVIYEAALLRDYASALLQKVNTILELRKEPVIAHEFVEIEITGLLDFAEIFQNRHPDIDVHFAELHKRSYFERGFFNGNQRVRVRRLIAAYNNLVHTMQIAYALSNDSPQQLSFDNFEIEDSFREDVRPLIRQIYALIRGADISTLLRQKLLGHVSRLERELDKEKTTLEFICELLLDTCTAVSDGVEKLRPALERIEALAAAFRRREIIVKIENSTDTKLALPPPEDKNVHTNE